MSPCRVCNHTVSKELNRHHLVPKCDRQKGTRQITIKLCAEKHGCHVHLDFHEGDKEAAQRIRAILTDGEIQWIISEVGKEWLQTIYPKAKK